MRKSLALLGLLLVSAVAASAQSNVAIDLSATYAGGAATFTNLNPAGYNGLPQVAPSVVILLSSTGTATMTTLGTGNQYRVIACKSDGSACLLATVNVSGVAQDISASLLAYPIGVGSGAGSVTSIATTSPITGGPITTTGTIACATCGVTGSPLSQFASTTSLQLKGVISDETGSASLVFADTPTLVTPVLGVATATSVNKVIITAPVTNATLTIANGKTLAVSSSLTIAGTDSTTMTFPTTSATIARTDAANTFTGHQTIEGVTSTGATGSQLLVFATSPNLTTPVLGVATATSLLASGIVDGQAPITVTTSTPVTLGGTYKSGYTYNEHATAGTAITYNLPTAAAGLQYCVANAYNGSAANTGVLTVATSAAGQFIIFTDGTLSATGGNVTSGGAARDAACFVSADSTHWVQYTNSGTWTKH